jgi:hypothetical protein
MLPNGGMKRHVTHSRKTAAKKASSRASLKQRGAAHGPRRQPRSARRRLPTGPAEQVPPSFQRTGDPTQAEFHLGSSPRDDLGVELGEAFILEATSGEYSAEDVRSDDFSVETSNPSDEPPDEAELTGPTEASRSFEQTGDPPPKVFSHTKK